MSTSLLRFRAVPLRHKIIAAGVAVAIAGGVYVLSKLGMTKSATTASLSFNPGVARQIEPRVLDAREPAVALAQSILSDDVVKAVSRQAGVSFSAGKNDVTEFRSHLEITQPSAKTLRVSYHDADQKKSATAVNTVAIILAAWTPFPIVEPPPVALTKQAASPVRPPELDRRQHHVSPPPSNSLRELEASLRELEAQLSASDQKLASLSAEQASMSNKGNADLQPSNAESEHRRLLQAQLSAAEERLADLRVRYTDEYPDVETTKENISEVQRELASLPPVSNQPVLIANPKAADTSAAAEISQLRQDRLRLVQAIATEERRKAILREETTLSVQSRVATVQTVSLSQPQQAPIPVSGNPLGLSLENPFRLVRLASLNRSNLLWPVPLTGFLCGLLYLGIAMRRYQPIESVNPDAPGAMKTMDNALTFPEFPSTGILSESKTGGLIVENDTSVDRDKAPLIRSPEAAPHQVNASEAEGPRGKWEKKWEKIVRETLAQTSIGKEFKTFNRNDEAVVIDNQKQVYSEGSRAQERPSRNLKDLVEVVGDNIQDPDIWMPHTKAAQVALEVNDLDTAIREIKLAIAVAPGKLKTWLDNFLVQLENDQRRLPEANHGEIHPGGAAESAIASAIAKPVVRLNVMGLHPVLGRLTGPQDDA
ncbi:MAG TPA: hypothetical protein VE178_05305 [Silvibacterium sp.]|nr:hypothetical protein [Silvibacterium sp.]